MTLVKGLDSDMGGAVAPRGEALLDLFVQGLQRSLSSSFFRNVWFHRRARTLDWVGRFTARCDSVWISQWVDRMMIASHLINVTLDILHITDHSGRLVYLDRRDSSVIADLS